MLSHDQFFNHRGARSISKKQNSHIRFFFPEELDVSEFSVSLEDFKGKEYRVLKAKQRLRRKKKLGDSEKNQLVTVCGERLEGSPKKWRGEKKRFQSSSSQRRTMS